MGNIVKIVLGLNILAAGVGVFFGLTKSKSFETLKNSVKKAEKKATDADNSYNEIKKPYEELKKIQNALAKENQKNITAKKTAETDLETALTARTKAESDLVTVQNKLKKLDDDAKEWKEQAKNATKLKAQLTDFKNLGLSASEIQQRLTELQQLKDAAKPPPVKKKPKPKVNFGEIGKVGQWDAANQFGVFQAGADNGIKVGDKFTIFRGGSAIGKIVVQRVTPVLSVFKADPAFGQPQSPYKIGDSVMKTN